MASPQQKPTAAKGPVEQYDAIIIGAGVTGLYELYRLRQLGISVRLFDDGSGVGGTWYWNRYPGARFDSESYTYGYSFSEELLQEWDWKEHFSGQPENEKYLNYVADKFNLRPNIQLMRRSFRQFTTRARICGRSNSITASGRGQNISQPRLASFPRVICPTFPDSTPLRAFRITLRDGRRK